MTKTNAVLMLGLCLAAGAVLSAQESMPSQMMGSWKIVRTLPTKTPGCWDGAKDLVGSTLTYSPRAMRWRGGSVPLTGVVTRSLTNETFQQESESAFGAPLTLADLRIMSPKVMEVDLQHEDADVTGATTEVPGDSVLLVGRNTIVVSACGTYFEATRVAAGIKTTKTGL
ncbi:hypothetical protein SAMN05421771_0701 [Granulicella pectinivorans]|uniref:Lipocalin-like domain-containing protein n=1 Tax=Granulicella pectinivorans TaxID=474950 RepID=A0A1I6LGM3_9BACT|nr:hypothetical protein [Granulicella pectinivorans]SFS02675.1 hypothetical protein SAMN05421771_0701 [Granulicella pectinivorans]